MKKSKKAFVLMMAVIMGISATVFIFSPRAAASELAQSPITIVIDGQVFYPPDAQPYISNDRVMIPFRPIAEALGATANWEGNVQRVTVALGSRRLEFFIGNAAMTIITSAAGGGFVSTAIPLESPAVLVGGNRAFVPMRALSEGLGATVNWVEATRTVQITSPPRPTPTPLPTRPPVQINTATPIPRTPTRTPTRTPIPTLTSTPTPTSYYYYDDYRDLRGRYFTEIRKTEAMDRYDWNERFVLLYFDSRRNDFNRNRMDDAIRAVEEAGYRVYFVDDAYQSDFGWFGETYYGRDRYDIPNPVMFFVEDGRVRDTEQRFSNIRDVSDRIHWFLR